MAVAKGGGGVKSLNFNVGILGHIDSGKTSLGTVHMNFMHILM